MFYDVTTYISNRPNQFNYPLLESLDLPIGSGIVEGGHKSIIQKRLIKSGSGWKTDNAKNIVNLRLLNANNQWNEYWDSHYRTVVARKALFLVRLMSFLYSQKSHKKIDG